MATKKAEKKSWWQRAKDHKGKAAIAVGAVTAVGVLGYAIVSKVATTAAEKIVE